MTSYAPLPAAPSLSSASSSSSTGGPAPPPPPLVHRGTRTRRDGRALDQFRPVYLTSGSITQAAGSAYIEMEGTKVLCAVHEPSASSKDLRQYSEVGALRCDFKYAPFAEPGARREFRQGTDEKDLSRMVEQALAASVRLELYPKSVINIHVLVLQAQGAVLAAAITCASVALADAGIECFDLVASPMINLCAEIRFVSS